MDAIGRRDDVALLLARELGDRADRGDFHFLRDRRRANVERAAEDEGEAQDVVDLVRIVRAARREHRVGTHGERLLGQDLGRRVREREDQRPLGHHLDHLGLEYAAGRQAEEDVGALDDLGELACVGRLRIARLVRVHEFGTAFVDDACEVGHEDVLARHAHVDQQIEAGERRGARARGHELDFLDVLLDDLEAVGDGGRHDDRGAVLVIVEHRDLHALAGFAFDREAIRRLDVLEVDAAEGGLERGDHVDELHRVGFVEFDVEHVDAGEFLEQHRLAFHDGLRGERPDVAEAEYGGAVRDHADEVAARREAGRVEGIGDDLLAGRGDARRVGEREIALVQELLGWRNGNFAGGGELVVIEGGFAEFVCRRGHGGT